MADITNQDRRVAYEWAASIDHEMDCWSAPTRAIARIILATVDAPEPTLAEELEYRADLLDNGDPDGDTPQALRDLAAHAAQMEHDLTEARAEVKRERDLGDALALARSHTAEQEVLDAIDAHYDHYPAQKGAESNAETPDPADVKPGEAWLVEVNGERRTALKDGDRYVSWNTVNTEGHPLGEANNSLTLVTRLVPAPRVITNADDLDRLPHNSVILSADNDAWQKSTRTILWSSPWWDASHGGPAMWPSDRLCDEDHPVTVLWEPGA
ncbi:MAG: hypothetical protein L0L18_00950 [Acidipropionibacterium jensenii]|nr:hypothetical protein [Acidipropionibacterium jensenii]